VAESDPGCVKTSRYYAAKTHIRHAYDAAVTAGDGRAIAKTYQVRSRLILDPTDKPGRKVLLSQ
jgi:hypothetical protein